MKTILAILLLIQCAITFSLMMDPGPAPKTTLATPLTPADIKQGLEQERKQRVYDAAENVAAAVMKHYRTCRDGEFAEAVAHAAVDESIPVRLVAAVVIVESGCNPEAVGYTVDKQGRKHPEGIGLMQVVPRIWQVPSVQLKNPLFNIKFATHNVLAPLIRAYGLREGLHHYNGMGVGCSACDSGYSDKVLSVAGYAFTT